MMTDKDALDCIAWLLDGEEWDADRMEVVANLVRKTGRAINEAHYTDED